MAGVTFYKAYELGSKTIKEFITKKYCFGLIKKVEAKERYEPFRAEVDKNKKNVEQAIETLFLDEAHKKWRTITFDEPKLGDQHQSESNYSQRINPSTIE